MDLHTSTIFDLQGRVALISGGGTGIGLMIARGLAANGAKVYIGSRRKDVLQKVADEWASHDRGMIIPYVQSNDNVVVHTLHETYFAPAFPSMSLVGKVSSRLKSLSKKRRGNCIS